MRRARRPAGCWRRFSSPPACLLLVVGVAGLRPAAVRRRTSAPTARLGADALRRALRLLRESATRAGAGPTSCRSPGARASRRGDSPRRPPRVAWSRPEPVPPDADDARRRGRARRRARRVTRSRSATRPRSSGRARITRLAHGPSSRCSSALRCSRCSRRSRAAARRPARLLPATSTGIVVLDVSASISSDTYARIAATLDRLVALATVVRTDPLLGYGLPGAAAGHAGAGAPAVRAVLPRSEGVVARRAAAAAAEPVDDGLQRRHPDLDRSLARARRDP